MHVRHLLSCALPGVMSIAAAQAATLPAGTYGCYTYNPKPIYVGEIAIARDSYNVARFGTTGAYSYDAGSGKVAWRGKPPLGFEAAVLETDMPSGRKQLRMYPKEADIGNKWKAALCSRKDGDSAASTTTAASTTASTPGVGAKAAAHGFKAGDRVMAEFIGVPYPATVVAAEAARVRLHYDDPKSKDEWVDVSRVKPRK